MKYAYVSGITNDMFLNGLLTMFKSLNECCKDRSIDRVCFVTDDVSIASIKEIESNDIICRYVEKINVDTDDRWKTTFQKLSVFSFVEYSKIVWVDADMMIVKNLDQLFLKPHMSCVRSRSPMITGGGYSFNSGLMVIIPDEQEYNDLIESIPEVINRYHSIGSSVGDQNVLNEYYREWDTIKERHLEDGYNVFWGSIDKYIDEGYSVFDEKKKPIYVLHYTGKHKPWSRPLLFIIKTKIRSVRHLHHFPAQETTYLLKKYYEYHNSI